MITRTIRWTTLVCVTSLLLLLPLGAGQASAALGDLDASFGSSGVASFLAASPPDIASSEASAMHVLPSGKILVAGARFPSSTPMGELTITRLNADGSLDLSFGGGDGFETHSVPSYRLDVTEILVQPSGMIVVTGDRKDSNVQYATPFLARFTDVGFPDSSLFEPVDLFADVCSEVWIVCTPVLGAPVQSTDGISIEDSILTSDGGIILVGAAREAGVDNDSLVVKYEENGQLDTGFATNGIAKVDTSDVDLGDFATAIVELADDRLLVFGDAYTGTADLVSMMRFSSAGVLDNTFDSDGIRLFDLAGLGGVNFLGDAALQPDGKIVLAATAVNPSNSDLASFAVARIDADGQFDPTFDGDGRLLINFGDAADTYSTPSSIGIGADGDITVLGDTNSVSTADDFVSYARVTASGPLNTNYTSGGKRVLAELGRAEAKAVAVLDKGAFLGVFAADDASSQRVFKTQVTPVPAPIAGLVPQSKIKSPSKSKLKRKKLKTISGTAGPAGSVAKVEIALQRVDAKLLKKSKRCLWLSSSKAKFKKTKATRKKCSTPRFLKATGTTNWRYSLKKTLPAGSYKLFVRVTLTDGTKSSGYSVKGGTLSSFKLTK